MDGVGEALVFTLKTSLRLKTGGLCTVPYPGVDLVKVKVNTRGQIQHKALPR